MNYDYYSPSCSSIYIHNSPFYVNDRKNTLKLINYYLKPVLSKASKLTSDIDKVKYIHDWLIYNVNNENNGGNLYSAAILKCGGRTAYSITFVYCMQKLGIESTIVCCKSGYSWNMVKIDGDWYELDIYCDSNNTGNRYKCFMQTTASLQAVYSFSDRCTDDCSDLLPIAYGTKYSPDNYKYEDDNDFSNLAEVVIPKKSSVSSSDESAENSNNTPKDWYKFEALIRTGKHPSDLKKNDWVKNGDFHFIPAGSYEYYVYDVEYDNYYIWNYRDESILWYDYQSKVWLTLK